MNKNLIKFIILQSLLIYSCSSNTPNNSSLEKIDNGKTSTNTRTNINKNDLSNSNNTNNNQNGILENKSADSNPTSIIDNSNNQNNKDDIQKIPQPSSSNQPILNSNDGRIGISINFNPPCKKGVDPGCN